MTEIDSNTTDGSAAVEYVDFGLVFEKPKNGKCEIVAKSDDVTLHADMVNISSARNRAAFKKVLVDKGCDPEQVDQDLLSIFDEVSTSTTPASAAPTVTVHAAEVDLSDIHRPERFMMPGISGLTVPLFLEGSNGIVPKWKTYAIADGERFNPELSSKLKIGERTVYISPCPEDPSVNNKTGWSRQSRIDWMESKLTVDPANLFKRLVESIEHHVEFESRNRQGILATVACWVVLTYCYQVWPAVPYLFLNGPAGSGKSTTFDVLRRLCFRVFKTDLPSPSTIFRTLHEYGGTFLYDEAERLKQTKADDIGKINAMLLAGYRRGGAADLMEKVGDGFKRCSFQVYGPKAIANINGLPAALSSRCIEITMQKADPDSDKPNRQIGIYDWQNIVDDLHILSLDHGDDWLAMAGQNRKVEGLNGRDNELWKPLVSISQWFESKGVEGLTQIMVDFANRTADDSRELATSDIDLTLLTILASGMKQGKLMTNKEILEDARDDDGTTFKSWSPRGIGSRLRAFGLRTQKSNGRRIYRDIDKLIDIQRRHGLDLGLDTSN